MKTKIKTELKRTINGANNQLIKIFELSEEKLFFLLIFGEYNYCFLIENYPIIDIENTLEMTLDNLPEQFENYQLKPIKNTDKSYRKYTKFKDLILCINNPYQGEIEKLSKEDLLEDIARSF